MLQLHVPSGKLVPGQSPQRHNHIKICLQIESRCPWNEDTTSLYAVIPTILNIMQETILEIGTPWLQAHILDAPDNTNAWGPWDAQTPLKSEGNVLLELCVIPHPSVRTDLALRVLKQEMEAISSHRNGMQAWALATSCPSPLWSGVCNLRYPGNLPTGILSGRL